MRKYFIAVLGWALILLGAHATAAQSDEAIQEAFGKLSWIKGPSSGPIAGKASIQVPTNYVYLNEVDTSTYLELAGNPPTPGHYLIAPDDLRWFAVFSFDDTGYIKDDEKIEAADLLEKLQSSDQPSNEARKSLGLPALYTEGWQVEPHYDQASKRLEWGVRLRGEDGEKVINYTSRLLSRTGVMSAILVSSPDSLSADTAEFKEALSGFEYDAGEKYAEFKSGDKVAAYGLGALILGGAAAVATKKGLWASIAGLLAAGWKLILGAIVALFAGAGRIFKKKDS